MIENQESEPQDPEEHGHAHVHDSIDPVAAKEEYIKNQEKSFESLTNFYAKQHKRHPQEVKDKIENILRQR
jgi:hypothetical protein